MNRISAAMFHVFVVGITIVGGSFLAASGRTDVLELVSKWSLPVIVMLLAIGVWRTVLAHRKQTRKL